MLQLSYFSGSAYSQGLFPIVLLLSSSFLLPVMAGFRFFPPDDSNFAYPRTSFCFHLHFWIQVLIFPGFSLPINRDLLFAILLCSKNSVSISFVITSLALWAIEARTFSPFFPPYMNFWLILHFCLFFLLIIPCGQVIEFLCYLNTFHFLREVDVLYSSLLSVALLHLWRFKLVRRLPYSFFQRAVWLLLLQS